MSSTTMKVADLKKDGFYLVKESIKNADELIDMLYYIDFLAQNNMVDPGEMALPIEEDTFKLTKSEVTALFFGHIEEHKEVLQAAAVSIPESEFARLSEHVVKNRSAYYETKMRTISDYRARAERCIADAENLLTMAVQKNLEINFIRGEDPLIAVKALVDGLHKTNWNFLGFSMGVLSLKSRSDIMLVHKVPEAGISYDLNCGKFVMQITLSNMAIKMIGDEGSVSSNMGEGWYIHPHVGSSSHVCWGNAKASAEEARLKGDILKTVQIIDALLPNYGSNPFILIGDFHKNIEKRDERLRREREQKDKAPEPQTGPFADQEFIEPDDLDEPYFEGENNDNE